MKNMTIKHFFSHLSIAAGLLTALLQPLPAVSEVLNLPSVPFDSSSSGSKPNFLYVLDNSSSMNKGQVNEALEDAEGQCKVSTKNYNDARKITALSRTGTTLKINAEIWWDFNKDDIVYLAIPNKNEEGDDIHRFSGVYKITKRNFRVVTPGSTTTTGRVCQGFNSLVVKNPYFYGYQAGGTVYPGGEAIPYYVAPCTATIAAPANSGSFSDIHLGGGSGPTCEWFDPADDAPGSYCTGGYSPGVTTTIPEETEGDGSLEVTVLNQGKTSFDAGDIKDAYILKRDKNTDNRETSKCIGNEPPQASAQINGLFYDPTVNYQPPPSPTGIGTANPLLPSMNRANTANWTQVRRDGTQLDAAGNQVSATFNIKEGVWQDMVYCDTPNRPVEFNGEDNPDKAWYNSSRCKRNSATTNDVAKSPNYPYKYPARVSGVADTPSRTIITTLNSELHQNRAPLANNTNPVADIYAFGRTDLFSRPFYYNVRPVEYCTDAKLQDCVLVEDGAPDDTYKVPSYVRYCTNYLAASSLSYSPDGNYCQGQYGNNDNGQYRFARYGLFERVDIKPNHTYPKTPGRSDCLSGAYGANGCSYDEEMTNVANWISYYSNRIKLMKSASAIALYGLTDNYRVGFMTINRPELAGRYLPIADFGTASSTPASTQKKDWLTKLYAIVPDGSTPLREALSVAGQVYAAKHPVAGYSSDDPVQYACQKNFTLLTTDGYWNDPIGGKTVTGAAIGNLDANETTSPRPKYEGNVAPGTLADVAKYYYDTDIRDPAFGNCDNTVSTNVCTNAVQKQNMKTYTLGLGVDGNLSYPGSNYDLLQEGDFYRLKQKESRYYWDPWLQDMFKQGYFAPGGLWDYDGNGGYVVYGHDGTGWYDFILFDHNNGKYYMIADWAGDYKNWPKPLADDNQLPITTGERATIDDLWHAAVNSEGVYYSAKSPKQLKDSFESLVASIGQEYYSGAPPAVSSQEPAAGDYAFSSSFVSKTWTGNLVARELSTVETEFFRTNETQPAVWCADEKTRLDKTVSGCPGSDKLINRVSETTDTRRIFMKDGHGTAANGLSNFKFGDMSSAQAAYFTPAYLAGKLTQINSLSAEITAAGGTGLVNFLRGQTGYEERSSNPENKRLFRGREVVLGDITDSDPVHVAKPLFSYTDGDFLTFKNTGNLAAAAKTVYVGANDGMLHAFDATNGKERWAFVPSALLPKMYKLAEKYYTSMHANYVNGDISVGHVCNNPCNTTADWNTILVGGLAQGGRAYYALDITNPDNPKLLWEFSNADDSDLGYSYGKPVIGKKPDGTWVVLVTSGYNNGAAGRLYVLGAKGNGAGGVNILSEIVTSSDNDSGLAQISGFTKNPQTNNMVQYVYGGDLLGNLWKFDIVNNSVALFAKLVAGANQPITVAPILVKEGTKILVFVGTGKLLENADLTSSGQQTLYAMIDNGEGVTIYNPRSASGYVQQEFTSDKAAGKRTVTNNAVNLAIDKGWWIDLDANERQTIKGQLYNGVLTIATTVNSGEICSPEGYGWINQLNYSNGQALDGTTSTSIGTFMGNPPTGLVALLKNGRVGSHGFDNVGGYEKPERGPELPKGGVFVGKRYLWRELIVDD
jgi:type IV pilus assembly protein PilY1